MLSKISQVQWDIIGKLFKVEKGKKRFKQIIAFKEHMTREPMCLVRSLTT